MSTDRSVLLAGPAFTVFLVAGAAAFPAPPGGDTSPASDPAWLADHTGGVIAQAYVRGLGVLAFVALVVGVAALCRRSSTGLGRIALAGGLLSGALMFVGQGAALAATHLSHAGSGGDAVRALGSLQESALDLSSIPALLLFGATGLAVLRSADLPSWFGWISLAGVPIALVDAASYDGGPLSSVGVVGLVYFLAWALVGGVVLFRATGLPAQDRVAVA